MGDVSGNQHKHCGETFRFTRARGDYFMMKLRTAFSGYRLLSSSLFNSPETSIHLASTFILLLDISTFVPEPQSRAHPSPRDPLRLITPDSLRLLIAAHFIHTFHNDCLQSPLRDKETSGQDSPAAYSFNWPLLSQPSITKPPSWGSFKISRNISDPPQISHLRKKGNRNPDPQGFARAFPYYNIAYNYGRFLFL
ncbi:hypothetical protein BT63DRAFT_454085 [Microthyrium microscopicum]|uniref:Uncharacterized protein n=1 Tax=Microthyrium microscopicum TaxID=703497 RepID=A0A6A6UEP7_9PEZI|nr:hypothetical protein BT63DRAFT_454085 [Microthyrium microscopicum]